MSRKEKRERGQKLSTRQLINEAAEKVDTAVYIWYNIIIKYRRWYYG